ncbi:MAG: HD domain-containing phosphohydrolase [Caldisericia bacterium]
MNLTRKNIIGRSGKEIFLDFDEDIIRKFGFVALNGKRSSFKFYLPNLKKHFQVNVFSPEKYYFGILLNDITGITEQEIKLNELLNFQLIIRKINSLINSCKNDKEFYKKVCNEIIRINGIIFAWIGLKSKDYKVKPVSFSGILSDYLKSIEVRWDNSELGFGPTGKAIKENRNIIINNISIDKDFYPWKEKATSFGVKSIASFPIHYEEEIIGALTIHSDKENFFNEDIVNVLIEISNDIGIGIRKFLDKEKIMDKTEELENTIDNMLSSFSKIIALKEPYTGNHSLRVSKLALLIGKEMKISDERLQALKYASFLHDLGKIFIPSEILNKYGRLTSYEFNLVKEHVIKSYEIIKDIKFPYPTHEIILQHHERIDGSGYPSGLKGNEILLEAKILAVSDVVDAMTSNRPYRPPIEIDKVIEELVSNKGILYDEEVVDITLKVLDKFIKN